MLSLYVLLASLLPPSTNSFKAHCRRKIAACTDTRGLELKIKHLQKAVTSSLPTQRERWKDRDKQKTKQMQMNLIYTDGQKLKSLSKSPPPLVAMGSNGVGGT